VTLAWSRRVRTWSAALREEARLKGLRRGEKDALIAARAMAPRRRVSPRA
jgi:predicted GIY-YIG superfamily endonuclease